jgi:hypothetical protein
MENNKLVVNKSRRNVPREELETMPREDLVSMIVKLEAHNKQLKNILEKKVKVYFMKTILFKPITIQKRLIPQRQIKAKSGKRMIKSVILISRNGTNDTFC